MISNSKQDKNFDYIKTENKCKPNSKKYCILSTRSGLLAKYLPWIVYIYCMGPTITNFYKCLKIVVLFLNILSCYKHKFHIVLGKSNNIRFWTLKRRRKRKKPMTCRILKENSLSSSWRKKPESRVKITWKRKNFKGAIVNWTINSASREQKAEQIKSQQSQFMYEIPLVSVEDPTVGHHINATLFFTFLFFFILKKLNA